MGALSAFIGSPMIAKIASATHTIANTHSRSSYPNGHTPSQSRSTQPVPRLSWRCRFPARAGRKNPAFIAGQRRRKRNAATHGDDWQTKGSPPPDQCSVCVSQGSVRNTLLGFSASAL